MGTSQRELGKWRFRNIKVEGALRSQQENYPDKAGLPIGQWFSVEGDFAPHGTFGNV